MNFEDITKIALLILSSFGIGSVIIVGLSSWLGKIWIGRILQQEKEEMESRLDEFRHELSLVNSSYTQHLNLILDYYAQFYKHYQRCRRAAKADSYRNLPDGEWKSSKDDFLENLDEILSAWKAYEGRIRLLLPNNLLDLHEQIVEKLNEFRKVIYNFETSEPEPRRKRVVFEELDEIKKNVEKGLREFLRTEKLLK